MPDLLQGLTAISISSLFFGINFLPVKSYDVGDGLFFQFMLCIGIYSVGILVQLYQNAVFEPLVLYGGLIWTTGNLTVVPCIQLVGLSLGMLLWGGTNLVMGWAVGYYGLFGVKPQVPQNRVMNIIGVVLCTAALSLMFFITTNEEPTPASRRASPTTNNPFDLESPSNNPSNQYTTALLKDVDSNDKLVVDDDQKVHSQPQWTNKLSPSMRRIVGTVLALFGGLCYGVCMCPAQYLIDSGKGSPNGIDYVHSHFSGILFTSTAYFILYTVLSGNKPQINPSIALPAYASGILWAIAQAAFFVANDSLGFIVSFPVLAVVPSILATGCGILLYNEISGKRNFQILGVSIATTAVGCLFIALSMTS